MGEMVTGLMPEIALSWSQNINQCFSNFNEDMNHLGFLLNAFFDLGSLAGACSSASLTAPSGYWCCHGNHTLGSSDVSFPISPLQGLLLRLPQGLIFTLPFSIYIHSQDDLIYFLLKSLTQGILNPPRITINEGVISASFKVFKGLTPNHLNKKYLGLGQKSLYF